MIDGSIKGWDGVAMILARGFDPALDWLGSTTMHGCKTPMTLCCGLRSA